MPDPAHRPDGREADFGALLGRVHAIGREALGPHAGDVDRDARFPHEAVTALRRAKLLSALVSRDQGGLGLTVGQVARVCDALGQYCGSSAMIFAMHQIQVACIVRHARQSPYFRDYLGRLVEEQRLIASATTEIGVGGDLRTSKCAVHVQGDSFRLSKQAPVISYGEDADDLLITCRRGPDAAPNEQVQVLVHRADCEMTPLSGWDTLGFRGTCSSGFAVTATGSASQVLPEPFADILSRTMHPVSHLVWGSLWCGIAADAVNRARAFVRAEARKSPGETPLCAVRLAEVDQVLQEMRHNIAALAAEYESLLAADDPAAFGGFGFAIRTNNLKLSCSRQVVDIVGRAMLICGISGYRNDSKYSLARHLRDAHGAALMVNNDRIAQLNATMLLAHKEGSP